MAPSLHFIPSDKPHFLSFPIRHPLPTRTSTWLCFPFEANVSTRDLFKGSGSQPLTCRLCAQCGVQWSDMSMAASSLLTMPHEVNSSKLAQLCKVLRSSYGEEEKSWGSIKHKLGRENPAGRRQLLPLLGWECTSLSFVRGLQISHKVAEPSKTVFNKQIQTLPNCCSTSCSLSLADGRWNSSEVKKIIASVRAAESLAPPPPPVSLFS